MSEPGEESGTPEEQVSLEEALAQNWAAASGEEESTDSEPLADSGDVTTDETQVEQVAETVQESQDPLEPLEKWTDEYKQLFGGLDRQSQQFLLDRHQDVESHLTKETQSLAESRRRYEKLDEVLNPYFEALRPKGVDLEPHIANALQAYFAYQQNPLETIQTLMNTAGLTADQFIEDEHVDPSIRALRTELQNTQRELASLKSQPLEQQESDAQRQLENFTTATNDDGSKKYPHFDQVRSVMAPLVNDGMSMEDAYNRALWMLPEHQKSQMDAAERKAKDELEVKRKQKAASAKKASDVLPSSDVDQTQGQKPAANWQEALEHTLSNMK
jgi:hypothetical protein